MAKQTISRDIPLSEITLRRYEKPVGLSERDLLRKLCLSIGLLQTGDSRDVVVDVLQALLRARSEKKTLAVPVLLQQVIALRTQYGLPLKGVAPSNIRRQLKRLRELFLAEKMGTSYRITEFESLSTLFDQKIKNLYLSNIVQRVDEYFRALP